MSQSPSIVNKTILSMIHSIAGKLLHSDARRDSPHTRHRVHVPDLRLGTAGSLHPHREEARFQKDHRLFRTDKRPLESRMGDLLHPVLRDGLCGLGGVKFLDSAVGL